MILASPRILTLSRSSRGSSGGPADVGFGGRICWNGSAGRAGATLGQSDSSLSHAAVVIEPRPTGRRNVDGSSWSALDITGPGSPSPHRHASSRGHRRCGRPRRTNFTTKTRCAYKKIQSYPATHSEAIFFICVVLFIDWRIAHVQLYTTLYDAVNDLAFIDAFCAWCVQRLQFEQRHRSY